MAAGCCAGQQVGGVTIAAAALTVETQAYGGMDPAVEGKSTGRTNS